ncbi:hypothetical protein CPSG_09976 [Coccidioides posadasii str. Silveira]|uniref:Uncharacterized protein n=1 Tax=Coccidioides posadasii (strain RMSCC 757 / Silveira) TaxID=443226 RepID=E9DJH7_COCPS|nr:hypothetical protein CPSG_09976 [Coccidioides posadasii str. Silveira]
MDIPTCELIDRDKISPPQIFHETVFGQAWIGSVRRRMCTWPCLLWHGLFSSHANAERANAGACQVTLLPCIQSAEDLCKGMLARNIFHPSSSLLHRFSIGQLTGPRNSKEAGEIYTLLTN